MFRALWPRFVVVVVAAPLAFVGALYAAQRLGLEGDAAAAVAAAVTFTAIVLAPSHKNALVRGVLLLGAVALFAAVGLVAGHEPVIKASALPITAPPSPPP